VNTKQNPSTTYKVVAAFEAKDGSGRRRYRTIARGLDIWTAIEKKEDIVLHVDHCIGAFCYPEGGRA